MHKKCPICKKPPIAPYTPFCCKRCADVDLGKWLSERYVMESDEPAIEEMHHEED